MPTGGAYDFKLAAKAVNGVVSDESDIAVGEWAWIDRTADYGSSAPEGVRWLMIYARDPDCKMLVTLWRRRGTSEANGHTIDSQGNISPSVLHTWPVEGKEACGFHTQPTRLLGFVDLR